MEERGGGGGADASKIASESAGADIPRKRAVWGMTGMLIRVSFRSVSALMPSELKRSLLGVGSLGLGFGSMEFRVSGTGFGV